MLQSARTSLNAIAFKEVRALWSMLLDIHAVVNGEADCTCC